jgi:GNAT superfamily N-acetyltransferase
VNGAPFTPNDIVGERTAFVVARWEGEAVGCGAFHPISDDESDAAEIRRMYVEPRLRRRGISRAILAELERLAREYGYTTVRLETGLRQPNAIRLYETSGHRRIEPFGRHRNDPLSVCFEKGL